MAINNFNLIAPMMHFDNDSTIYFVEIIARGKDVGTTGEKWIKDYHIRNMAHFQKAMPEIIEICDKQHARAYIRLNCRDIYRANQRLIKRLVDCELQKQPLTAPRLYASVLGECGDEPKKTRKWIVDVDACEGTTVEALATQYTNWINNNCQPLDDRNKVICRIPSKTGLHLITKPFNKQDFSKEFHAGDCVMPDGITNLYIAD